MPDITIVIWNVETFGDAWLAQRGANYTPICRFIARVLDEVDADVFCMMELRSGGTPYLATLRAAINNLQPAEYWRYEWIPGAVVPFTPFPPANAADLGFLQAAHSEGYALLWRDKPEFDMLDTRVALSGHPLAGNSRIGLVFTGRPPALTPAGWFSAPNFDPANPPAVWNQLDFPIPAPIHAGDIRWDQSRRPCYFVLDLNRVGVPRSQQLLPILVFHAPNSLFSTRFAVQCNAYSTELYQVDDTTQPAVAMTNVNQAFAAGDFNLNRNDANDQNTDAYFAFSNDFNYQPINNQGGAQLRNIWVSSGNLPDNLTAVRLSRQDGTPIVTNNPRDYYWLAIDNAFYRNLNAVLPAANYSGPVYDIVAEVMQHGNLVNTPGKRAVVQSFAAAIAAQVANYPYTQPVTNTPSTRKRGRDDQWIYTPIIANLQNYIPYSANLNLGYFTNARRAAEFVVNSISDHLPLVFRFTV